MHSGDGSKSNNNMPLSCKAVEGNTLRVMADAFAEIYV